MHAVEESERVPIVEDFSRYGAHAVMVLPAQDGESECLQSQMSLTAWVECLLIEVCVV